MYPTFFTSLLVQSTTSLAHHTVQCTTAVRVPLNTTHMFQLNILLRCRICEDGGKKLAANSPDCRDCKEAITNLRDDAVSLAQYMCSCVLTVASKQQATHILGALVCVCFRVCLFLSLGTLCHCRKSPATTSLVSKNMNVQDWLLICISQV